MNIRIRPNVLGLVEKMVERIQRGDSFRVALRLLMRLHCASPSQGFREWVERND